MKNLITFNYEVTKKRGLIDSSTTKNEFIMKLEEEIQEFIDSAINDNGDFNHELADIVLVCFNIAKHYNIDIEKQLLNNILKNLKR